jgi:phytanoyl-CoA hydroxylase
MKIESGRLSEEQVAFFQKEGYFIAENVFDPADLEPFRQHLEREIGAKIDELARDGKIENTHPDEALDQRLTRIYHDNKENGQAVLNHLAETKGSVQQGRSVFDLIAHPKLSKAVASIVGPEIVASAIYRIRPKIPGVGLGNVPWHQDSGYFMERCDKHLIVTCWIPMVDATVENGCMEILPRSHKRGILKHHTGGNSGFLVVKDDDLPSDVPEKFAAECPVGGVVFMTNMTPHSSTQNSSDTIRWSVDLRFQSADVPNNVGLWPDKNEEDAEANVQIACYPPEADFVVSTEKDPDSVATYESFTERRSAFEPWGPENRPRVWAPLA